MKRDKIQRWFQLLTFFVGLSASSAVGQDQELKWNLQEGDRFEVSLIQTSTSRTIVDSRETSTENSTTIVIDWNVTRVAENGDATIEQSLRSIKLLVGDPAVPAQAIRYDTGSDEDITRQSRQLMEQVQPLLGLRFDTVMSLRGEIKSVSLPEKTQEALNLLPATMRLRALFSESGLNDILGASVVVLPDQELQPGGQWVDEKITPTAFGKFSRKQTYTFIGMKTVDGREFAEIKLVTGLDPVADDTPKTKGASLNGSLNSFAGSGSFMLDVAGGFFSSSKVENRIESEKPYREKTIKTVVSSKVEMSVVKR